MNIEKLLKDYNVLHVLPGEHSHCTPNSVNVHCPFCSGSADYHLGISTVGKGCNCWRCGSHSLVDTLSAILGMPPIEVRDILRQYDGTSAPHRTTEEAKVSIRPLKFPTPNGFLSKYGKDYLHRRRFDPDKLMLDWGIRQTGMVSFLDGIDYGMRLLIPIEWGGKVVSFQTRDITGMSDVKYKTCPKEREIIHHKNILYGKQEKWNNYPALIVVEGITDVWRLGYSAAATFGIEFKLEQVLALSKIHDRFIIMFDNEPQAQKQARKLGGKLKALGKRVSIETVKNDPGDMKQDEADYLVKQLHKGEINGS